MDRRGIPARWLAGIAIVSLLLAGCTGETSSPAASTAGGGGTASAGGSPGAGGGGTVAVTLQEWSVNLDADSAPAGEVTFQVTNDGPADIHEFVVIRTDLDPGDLPVDENGVVDESGEGIDEVVDEIEDIAVGDTQELTVTLDAGNYVLLCNIWSEEEQESHYQMGMRTAFTATE
jgi:uncharacterized cupredoxin-like copper-binding protein